MKNRLIITLLFFLFGYSACAHEVRPAYLGIKQVNDSTYLVIWKIPALGDKIPKINPVFPGTWSSSSVNDLMSGGALKRQWTFTATSSIKGEKIYIEGLASTLIDVLINIELQTGEQYSVIIKPDRPFYNIPFDSSALEVISTYLWLGVDHIIFGIDHLLFVLALIFVTRGKWKIIKTVTAFTLAHSITLSLAALGLMTIPIPPVEAIIALSIVFLAREIMLHDEMRPSLTYRQPWIVAFAFGLLHGFGFASALSETGLPQGDIPLALAFFNIGVEVGQIAFVLVILLIEYAVNRSQIKLPKWVRLSPIYVIGGWAGFWVIERVIGFWP